MAAGQATLKDQFAKLKSDADAALEAGLFAAAEDQYRQLVQLQRRALGPEHEDTLSSQIGHASALGGLGRCAEGEAILREVLQVQQQSPSFGMEHESTLFSVMALGRCLLKQGRFNEAEPMLRNVYGLDVRVLGPRHHETLGIQLALGKCLAGQQQFEEAEGLLRDALVGYQGLRGIPGSGFIKFQQTAVGSGMWELAACMFKAGKHAEAESLLRAAVKYTRHNLGEENPITISCISQHAKVLTTLGQHAAAEVMFRLAVQRYRATCGLGHCDTLSTTHDYAQCLLDQHKLAPAEALLRDTLSDLQQALGDEHPTVLRWMRDLAEFLQQQGQVNKRNEAKAMLRRARELERSRQG